MHYNVSCLFIYPLRRIEFSYFATNAPAERTSLFYPHHSSNSKDDVIAKSESFASSLNLINNLLNSNFQDNSFTLNFKTLHFHNQHLFLCIRDV